MTARRVKQVAQMPVTRPTSRSLLRLPLEPMGNLHAASRQPASRFTACLQACVRTSHASHVRAGNGCA